MTAAERLAAALAPRLRDLDHAGLLRHETVPAAGERVFCSNDYLGLARDPRLKAAAVAALEADGTGAGASRLVSGSSERVRALERDVADWMCTDDALVFGSGYQANVGLLSALLGEGDAVFSDALNHASIIDGIRLGRAERAVFPHRDTAALARQLRACEAPGARLVVTESIFSMDGDVADLLDLADVCDAYGALLVVDEAHALGVCGREGQGVVDALDLGDRVAARVGTFGKSVGAYGAFVAGPSALRDWLFSRARSLVYTTALPPAAVAAAAAGVAALRAGPERARLRALLDHTAAGLADAGLWRGPARSAIFPVLVGDVRATLALAARLRAAGFFVQAIRPPTVPAGTSRLRVTISAAHDERDIDALVTTLRSALDELGVDPRPHSHD